MHLITGGNGFVGGAVLRRLMAEGISTLATVRKKPVDWPIQQPVIEIGALTSNTDWSIALTGIQSVVHTAARVHMMKDQADDPLAEFRRVNVEGTLNLARQAATAGVRRFVFLSSIKVNGECTRVGIPFKASDEPKPLDPYGISKWEAEVGLREISKNTGMEVVIIRPTLVYGPGVRGNFLSMMQWLHKGRPLPLGAIKNLRSFVAIDNLVDLIATCMHHPAAANQTFLVSDGEDISITELLSKIAISMNKKAKLISIPKFLLFASAFILGKRKLSQRLIDSLQVDIKKNQQLLGWKPKVSLNIALLQTVKVFEETNRIVKTI